MVEVSKPRRSHPILIALAVVGALTLAAVFSIFGILGLMVSKIPGSFSIGNSSHHGKSLLQGVGSKEQIFAGIKLEGEINNAVADDVLEKLKEAETDTRIVGVLFEVNSPGGAVVPSQEMYDAIAKLKAKKPLVSYVRDVAASGAMYSMAPSTKIVANRTSMVGSIGVILSSFEASDLFTLLKVKPMTLKTGALKDAGNPARVWNDQDKAYLQDLIEKTRTQFANDVKKARNLSEPVMKLLSDGRVVLGQEAFDLKLVDELGDRDTAIAALALLAKVEPSLRLEYLERNDTKVPRLFQYLMEEGGKSFVKGSLQEMKQSSDSQALKFR
jgi:protease IV